MNDETAMARRYHWLSVGVESYVKEPHAAICEAQAMRSTTDDGVWKLPDGDAYYAYRLRTETTTRITPQQVHDIGVSEVTRIEGEMKSLLPAQGELQPGETPAQALARLAKDPRFLVQYVWSSIPASITSAGHANVRSSIWARKQG